MSQFIQYGGYFIGNPLDKLILQGGDSDTETENDNNSVTSDKYEYVESENDHDIESTREEVLNNKTTYYNFLIDNAPEPLDQSPALTNVVKQDMKQIAKILLESSKNGFQQTPYFFKSSVVMITNQNNVKVPEDSLEKFATALKQKGLECIVNSREALHNLNSKSPTNMETCNTIINDMFITYMWSLANMAKEGDE